MFSDQMVEPEHTLVWTVFCLPPQHVALSVDVSEKKPELQVIQEFGKPNFFNAPPPSCTLRYSTMTLGPEVSAPCEADRLSGLSRSCMIRRSWVCSLLMCWTFFCYAVAVFFCFFLYHFNCECLSTTHLLKFIRRLRHHPHNVYFLFFSVWCCYLFIKILFWCVDNCLICTATTWWINYKDCFWNIHPLAETADPSWHWATVHPW